MGGQERELKRDKNRKKQMGIERLRQKIRVERTELNEKERLTEREKRKDVRWRGKGLMGLGDEIQRSLSHLTSKRSNS